ncbi:DMT family transporter [Actinoallomurus purpureus]|uniref:DMT family transporter n=1 Tax=Actinoallomurus purpureus TaxID=478114 RepID=UPI0020939C25|nr:DMT family transporter [Actinoallomurus purpureus]MCO6009776.1 DMT family transporter [Actinoallomurus purpureus]
MKTFFALAAACFLGIGFVAQQHVAYREPLDEMLRMRLLAHLIRQPVWLLGIAAMVCGQVLGAVALDESDLGRVEPLLATNLIFALVIAHLVYQEPLSRAVWWGGLLVTGGVVIFLAFGHPEGGRPAGPGSVRWVWAGVVLVVAAALVLAAAPRSLRTKAMLFAAAAGMLFGVQDALTRSSLLMLGEGLAAGLRSWQPYALVVIAVVALLLAQSAFDAAPIGISLPAMTAVEPIIGIVLGIVVFAEHLRLSEAALAAEVAGLVMIVAGIGVLGRSSFLGKPGQDTAPEGGPG